MMAFWGEQSPSDTPSGTQASTSSVDNLGEVQRALAQARRRLLGAVIVLAFACALIPWVLDSTPRAWGDDVVLRMPKSEQPYQSKPDNKPATTPATSPKTSVEVKP